MSYEYLSTDEETYCKTLLSQLSSVGWVQSLITKIKSNGGITKDNKDFLFELRFAAELESLKIASKYEFEALPPTSVDFKISNSTIWLIELCRIGISKAVENATTGDERIWEIILQTASQLSNVHGMITDDMKQSEEGEFLLIQQKICEKVFSDGKPIKFPIVNGNMFQLLLIDMRHFLLGIADKYDYDFIAFGKNRVPNDLYVRYWNGEPIKGIFEIGNPLRGIDTLRERIHFVGFVNEKTFGAGEFRSQIYYVVNPHLFKSEYEARKTLNAMPFYTESPDTPPNTQ